MKLVFDIQNEIMRGVLSFSEIAMEYGVSFSDVEFIALEMNAMVVDNDYVDDFEIEME